MSLSSKWAGYANFSQNYTGYNLKSGGPPSVTTTPACLRHGKLLFTFIYPLPVQIKLRHLHIGIIEVCHCCWSPWKHNIVASLIIEGNSPDLGLYMAYIYLHVFSGVTALLYDIYCSSRAIVAMGRRRRGFTCTRSPSGCVNKRIERAQYQQTDSDALPHKE